MPKTSNLSLMEEATLIVLCRQSPNKKDNLIHISREKIAEKIGIKDLDTVSKYTKKLVSERYITKTDSYDGKGHNLVKYSVCKSEKYRLLGNALYDLDPRLAAFVARLYDCEWNNTNNIYLNNREIAETINVKERSFYKYIAMAIKEGIVTKTDEGYVLSSKYYPIKGIKLSEAEDDVFNELMKSGTIKQSKWILWYRTNRIYEIDADREIYNGIVANTFKNN